MRLQAQASKIRSEARLLIITDRNCKYFRFAVFLYQQPETGIQGFNDRTRRADQPAFASNIRPAGPQYRQDPKA